MHINFKRWFRGLSKLQALIFYAWLASFCLLLFWHNPSQGYNRPLVWVYTNSYENALLKSNEMESKRGSSKEDWSYRWSDNWVFNQSHPGSHYGGMTDSGGFFYKEEPPWWWADNYISRGFDERSLPQSLKNNLSKLGSLGSLINCSIVITVAAIFLIWLTGIRSAPTSDKA